MTTFGYFLSSEEHGPTELLSQAQAAERAGFTTVSISDHFHPWMDSQGESPFVWTTIGGIAATTQLEITTAVTCPLLRIHPVIVAQAAATSAVLSGGRFRLGLGTGERLNEHILGQPWPPADIRRDMLRESIEVMRRLWQGGVVDHHGPHYTVENARLYTLPAEPVPIVVSGFGPDAIALAAEVADAYITTAPDADAVHRYRELGGKGPTIGTAKVCWAADEEQARKTAHRLWASSGVPGEASQELSMPAQFEQAAELVTPDKLAEKIPCGPDPDRHANALRAFIDAGFDEVHINQIGDDEVGFLEFFTREVVPRL